MKLDKSLPIPIDRQLVEQLLAGIRNGTYKPGDKLPTERELSQRYSISRGVVKKAYKELHDNGIINSIQGSGSYVHTAEQRPSFVAEMVDNMVKKLIKWNFSFDEIINLVHDSLASYELSGAYIRVALIDCNVESLGIFKQQLKHIKGINPSVFLVEGILLEDKPWDLLKNFELLLTTKRHYSQIADYIGDLATRLLQVSVVPSLNTISQISRLSSKNNISIICRSNMFADIIRDNLAEFSPKVKSISTHYENVFLQAQNTQSLLQQYDTIIIDPNSILLTSNGTPSVISTYTENGGNLILFDYVIDGGSLLYIEERVNAVIQSNQSLVTQTQ